MTRTDALWLFFLAVCLSVGVLGGSYLKKDQLLPICHSLAPGLFPPIVVSLRTGQSGDVFDSQLMHAGQPWMITFTGPQCQQLCAAHLAAANRMAADQELVHLVVSADSIQSQPIHAIGIDLASLQVAESLGLDKTTWNTPGYAATWRMNADHHIERRWVNRHEAFD